MPKYFFKNQAVTVSHLAFSKHKLSDYYGFLTLSILQNVTRWQINGGWPFYANNCLNDILTKKTFFFGL